MSLSEHLCAKCIQMPTFWSVFWTCDDYHAVGSISIILAYGSSATHFSISLQSFLDFSVAQNAHAHVLFTLGKENSRTVIAMLQDVKKKKQSSDGRISHRVIFCDWKLGFLRSTAWNTSTDRSNGRFGIALAWRSNLAVHSWCILLALWVNHWNHQYHWSTNCFTQSQ